jgi:hypothetical protein
MKFSFSFTKSEITELSKRAGIPAPRKLQVQLEDQDSVCVSSELQLSNISQFRLAKAILSSLESLGAGLNYGDAVGRSGE